MEKIERWKAYDGTIFKKKEDCWFHEIKLMKQGVGEKLKFFNDSLFELTDRSYEAKLEQAAYILVGNEAAFRLLKKLGDSFHMVVPDGIGFWVYDHRGNYYSVEHDINSMKDEIKILEKYLSLVEKEDIKWSE